MLFDNGFWGDVGVPALTGIITSGLVAGVVQVIFKARYDQRLESHKGRLSADNAREIERIRAESTIAAERFKKSYGLLAERQAEAIETIYGHLAEIHLALLRLVSPSRFGGEPSDPELLKTLHERRWEGMDYFRVKRLFLPADLGTEIDALYAKIAGSEMGFRFKVGGNEKLTELGFEFTKRRVDFPIRLIPELCLLIPIVRASQHAAVTCPLTFSKPYRVTLAPSDDAGGIISAVQGDASGDITSAPAEGCYGGRRYKAPDLRRAE